MDPVEGRRVATDPARQARRLAVASVTLLIGSASAIVLTALTLKPAVPVATLLALAGAAVLLLLSSLVLVHFWSRGAERRRIELRARGAEFAVRAVTRKLVPLAAVALVGSVFLAAAVVVGRTGSVATRGLWGAAAIGLGSVAAGLGALAIGTRRHVLRWAKALDSGQGRHDPGL